MFGFESRFNAYGRRFTAAALLKILSIQQLGRRKTANEATSLLRPTLDFELGIMLVQNMLYDRQPKARPSTIP